jgi:hypothetical protein
MQHITNKTTTEQKRKIKKKEEKEECNQYLFIHIY